MPGSPCPEPPRTLHINSGTVIPIIDNGDHRTVGIMALAAHHDLDVIVLSWTPDQARQVAADLLTHASR